MILGRDEENNNNNNMPINTRQVKQECIKTGMNIRYLISI